MARPAKFTEEQILDTTLGLIAAGGPGAATIAAIAKSLGAPVGSIYHRFGSRDLLVARLWIRTVKRFQQGFLRALDNDDLDQAALGAALHVVDWCRTHPDESRVLMLYRQGELAARWPGELDDELSGLNDDVESALRSHARRRYGSEDPEALGRLVFALADVPRAAVRRYLGADDPLPPLIDELVSATCLTILKTDR